MSFLVTIVTSPPALAADPLDGWSIRTEITQTVTGGGYNETTTAVYVDNDALSMNFEWTAGRTDHTRLSCGPNAGENGYDISGSGTGTGEYSRYVGNPADWQGLAAETYTVLLPTPVGDFAHSLIDYHCDGTSTSYGYAGSEGPISAPVFLPGSEVELAEAPIGDIRTATYQRVEVNPQDPAVHIVTILVKVTAVKIAGLTIEVGYNWSAVFLKSSKIVPQSMVSAHGSDFVHITGPADLQSHMRICIADIWTVDLTRPPGTTTPVEFTLPSPIENYDLAFSAASGRAALTTPSDSNCVNGLDMTYGNFFRGVDYTLPGGFKSDVKSLTHSIVVDIYLNGQVWSRLVVAADTDTAKYKKNIDNEVLQCAATLRLPYYGVVTC
jgi:hypothetical protein